ncbi:gluconate:H+ symporter [Pseudochryseolinea flava]|uniref:Gluconate transporter n=1 Tax=Pseudochryseolinea flava TaxID=2059302 RepID=A0A364XX30_9BACT|nr:gluconate:H+ symporter [Pseudochryseolinea flava]RAV98082.1 gluconate transporter [Pseudochryseolinea flava]
MTLLIIFSCIVLLIVLISLLKINAFLAFLIVSVIAGLSLGISAGQVTTEIQIGIGKMFGDLSIIVVCGAMLGKLTADSGAAQRIASGMMKVFGPKYIIWALVVTGFIIGIPLFYNVGFVLVMPLIFSVSYRFNFPPVYIGVPMLASLSVTHGFLPPHPSPVGLIRALHADIGTTMLYGIIVAIPTVIIAGPIFAKTLRNMKSTSIKTFESIDLPEDKLPSLFNSIFSALLPVILIAITTLLLRFVPADHVAMPLLQFFGDPAVVMILSLFVATFTLGIAQQIDIKKIMNTYGESVKDIAMLLLIMSGAGALKQILQTTGADKEIGSMLEGLPAHPLFVAWTIASIIRVCVGSATVAGLTAANIVEPFVVAGVDPNLLVLAVGAGSLMFSHVNDGGFWLFKEYFNLGIKDTIKSWSMMETIVAIVGIMAVMILNIIIH